MRTDINFIKLGNGVTLPYYEKGDTAGTAVIFLHGVTDSLRSFDRLAPLINGSVRAIFVTQRGHGDASRPESGYEPASMANDILQLMDALDIRSAVIVGHSMGSFVAQKLAIEAPERVRGLVLIGSFATCGGNQGIRDFVETTILDLEDPIPRDFFEEFQENCFNLPVPADYIDTMVNESSKLPAAILKQAALGMIETDHTSELSGIKCPTLILWGDQDAYFSLEEQEVLLQNIPDARLKTYPDVGHSPIWEVPQTVADDISVFLDDLTQIYLRAAA